MQQRELATFGAGCFWGVEELYRRVPGVLDTAVGYMGGTVDHPTYEQVCTDTTGHAEVVQVTYDPRKVSYQALLDIFWENHNPTTLNRQGPDVGTQYRSVIFFHTPEQQDIAEASRKAMMKSKKFTSTIVTTVEPAKTFWKAEDYHQQYLAKRGELSCHI